jgi:hypothetical protein
MPPNPLIARKMRHTRTEHRAAATLAFRATMAADAAARAPTNVRRTKDDRPSGATDYAFLARLEELRCEKRCPTVSYLE